jgi:hypothetical protein
MTIFSPAASPLVWSVGITVLCHKSRNVSYTLKSAKSETVESQTAGTA